MIQVNAVGDACPIPVVKTLQALKSLAGPGTVGIPGHIARGGSGARGDCADGEGLL